MCLWGKNVVLKNILVTLVDIEYRGIWLLYYRAVNLQL